jgi:aspartyl-tRNA(Asn)/glutamyl-tRNA(Gln) amidotransferase subunit A
MNHATIAELHQGLKNKTFSATELTRHCLDQIAKKNPELNAFVTVDEARALEQAKQADAAIAQGNIKPLTGIPIAQKDIFCTKGIKTTCGSKMLETFIAPYNAHIVDRFQHDHAIMIGKTNMDEFGMGSSNENSYFGPVKNPWNLLTTPGGSSGGSAAAIAAGLCPGATGSDTGGSIRQPAAFSGITGLKPTYGLVSRYGMIAYASSLDQAGPMAKTAEDCALMLDTMVHFDSKDSTCLNRKPEGYTKTLGNSLKGLKIGVLKNSFAAGVQDSVKHATQQALKAFEAQGAECIEVECPHNEHGLAAYYIIAPAEASSNLARYDGVRYGYRCHEPKDLKDLYERSRGEGFGPEVKRRILIGTYVLSSGHYDTFYLKAQKIRRLIAQDYAKLFETVDVVLSPTAPFPAFQLGEKKQDPLSMYLSDIFTLPVNLAGLPALSMPMGFTQGLPLGLQLVGPAFSEAKLLNVAHQYQQITDWHRATPAQ